MAHANKAHLAIDLKAFCRCATLTAILTLAGCASMLDAPRMTYACAHDLRFEARLYEDMALLEGLRGHAVLERVKPAEGAPAPDDALRYADPTVRAQFGLGVDGRLARLDYTTIPEPVYCQRVAGALVADAPQGAASAAPLDTPVRAHPRPGPRPPVPFDPNAPVETNIRTGDGNNGPG